MAPAAARALALCGLVDAVRMAVDLAGLASQLLIEPSRSAAIARVAREDATPG
jgi:hypothetical protein